MSIIAKDSSKEFTPAPEGLHQAVCVDVVDLGLIDGQWGPKHKVRVIWQLDQIDPENDRRFRVQRMYTLSLSDKATLRKDLECWRGRKFTKEELAGFDLEKLVSVNCQLQLIHNLSDEGKTYANIQAVIPLGKGMAKMAPQDYIRVKDRDEAKTNGNGNGHGGVTEDDEKIPF